jgi:hypothetical protein
MLDDLQFDDLMDLLEIVAQLPLDEPMQLPTEVPEV